MKSDDFIDTALIEYFSELDFKEVSGNSMDAVSDRDFVGLYFRNILLYCPLMVETLILCLVIP